MNTLTLSVGSDEWFVEIGDIPTRLDESPRSPAIYGPTTDDC